MTLLKFEEGKYAQATFHPDRFKENYNLEDCIKTKVDKHFLGAAKNWHQVAGTLEAQVRYSCDDHKRNIDGSLVDNLAYLYLNIEKKVESIGASAFCLCDVKWNSEGSDIHSGPLRKENKYILSMTYQPLMHVPNSKRLAELLLKKD